MKLKSLDKKEKKSFTFENTPVLLRVWQKLPSGFKSGIFSIIKKDTRKRKAHVAKVSNWKQLKILTPKQML